MAADDKKRKKRKKSKEKDPRRMRTRDVVAEGLYIASAATRLSLKNAILMHVLAGGENFAVDRYLPEAREILETLAAEAEVDAARIEQEQKVAKNRHYDSDGTHDYRSRDLRNLRRRQKQSLHVANELRARTEDEEEVRQIVLEARDAAWGEVAANIERTLDALAARPDLDVDYERMRTARMQALRLVDLPRLKAHRRNLAAHHDLLDLGLSSEEVAERLDGDDAAAPDEPAFDPAELE
ncbi:asparagine synthase [Microbacterium sp.]|uniref:asparagine synthase n=1 Tax=Microbacterium sp. TaxID=51671 RepID=UPI0039E52939